MRSTRTLILLALAASCFLPVTAQEPVPQYIIEANIIAIPAEKGQECKVVADQGTYTLRGNGGGMAAFGEIRELVCDDVTLTLRIDGNFSTLLWNGEESPPEDTVLEVISAPRVSTQAGNKAMIMSGSILQYFTKEEDGCFKLRFTDVDSPELKLALTPQPANDDPDSNLVEIELALSLKAMSGRETIRGVQLDVGRPIMNLRTMQSDIIVSPGQWHLVSGHQFTGAGGSEGDFLLILLRVQNVEDLPVALPEAPR